jgi:dUTP pyrophosphatase
MKVKIKKLHPDAVLPKYGKPGDAGIDLTATEIEFKELTDSFPLIAVVKFGISIEIPKGYVGLLFPRSSVFKTNAILSNSVGVVDSGYRGEIMANFLTDEPETFGYKVGDRAIQLIILPYPQIEFEEVEELEITERGDGGFGSTGK